MRRWPLQKALNDKNRSVIRRSQKDFYRKEINCTIVLIQMIVRVQPGLGTPIYLQIESQVKHAIAAGALKLDDALPPVRKLAAELRINPNTVARAYQNLERDGILRTVPGGGCYVNGHTPGLLKSEKLRRLRPLATQLAVEATQLRLAREDLVQLLENSYDELDATKSGEAQ